MSNKVYEIVTDQIIRQLEEGTVPWHKPWKWGSGFSFSGSTAGPVNLATKKPYRGINIFLLLCTPYESPYWVSIKQANKLGGRVRKDEKSSMVIFWKPLEVEDKENKNEDGTPKKKTIPLLRYYRVFNVEQCEGLESKIPQPPEPEPEAPEPEPFQPIECCEKVVEGMPNRPEIRHKEARAYYRPSEDFVNLPKQELFESPEEYYSTAFHELTHSTGHKSRLARPEITKGLIVFGSHDYSKEELVAEMGAAFLCGHCQIEQKTLYNSAAYIQGWLKKLRDDRKLVVHAAAAAQRAADYILGKEVKNYES